MTFEDTGGSTCSPALEAGNSPPAWPGGRQLSLFGLDPVPANRSAPPASAKVAPTNVTSGPRCSVSSASAALQSSLESRCRALLPSGGGTRLRVAWKASATPAGRSFCRLVLSAPPTGETGFGGLLSIPTPRPCSGLRSRGVNQTELSRALLPTPKASLAHAGADPTSHSPNLKAALLPTPMAGPGAKGNPLNGSSSARKAMGGSAIAPSWLGLTGTAALLPLVAWMMGYPRDWAGPPWPASGTRSSLRSGRSGSGLSSTT